MGDCATPDESSAFVALLMSSGFSDTNDVPEDVWFNLMDIAVESCHVNQ